MNTCSICQQTQEVRPYGPQGALICFTCMKATPGLEEKAKKNFGILLNANETAGNGLAVIDDDGLRPGTVEEQQEYLSG